MILEPNSTKDGFYIPSEYNKGTLKDWLKKYKAFDLTPRVEESVSSRRFLEGAVIPAYCEWQYGINARDLGKDEARRLLFKQDFNYEILENRKGVPVKSPLSSKGLASQINQTYTRYAEENGAPIPNASLYKLWRDKWRLDHRFPTFFDFLDFLELQCDSMPSDQTLKKLGVEEKIDYPENNLGDTAF
jgi:hypothetical protein